MRYIVLAVHITARYILKRTMNRVDQKMIKNPMCLHVEAFPQSDIDMAKKRYMNKAGKRTYFFKKTFPEDQERVRTNSIVFTTHPRFT